MKLKPSHTAMKTAAAMMAMSAMTVTSAQEASDEERNRDEVEEVIVVGSHIRRAISDAPQPISVIDSLDIEYSGITNTADLLRGTAYNSFGSFRERSGTSFGQIAQIDLRGLGAARTAILINGRRVPGNPLTGTSSVDLNTIPISAIDRIEILKDGASAVYGADAIGGVINIQLKKDFEGIAVGGSVKRPVLKGADSESFNILLGKSFDRGHVMFGVERFNREAISDADRPYSRSAINGTTFGALEGISVGGNTAFETNFSAAFPLGDCDTSLYAGTFTSPFGVPGSGCGFAYADISLQTGNIKRTNLFLDANFELTENSNLYFEGRLNQNQTSGRYAPAVGFFSFPASSPFNDFNPDTPGTAEVVPGCEDNSLPNADTCGGRNIAVFHRFVGHGNRDGTTDIDEITVAGGIEGLFGKGITYDAWVQYYDYSGIELGNTYVRESALEREAAAGRYDVTNPLSQDPIHLKAVADSSLELTRDLKSESISAGFTFAGDLFELPGGSVGWALGAEISDEKYTDIYDEFREAGDVLGSAGNTAQGDRKRWATFAEIRLPITDKLEVNSAARLDDFSDFGRAFSPQLALRFQPHEDLTLRASWGDGFKAPNLTSLYGLLAMSADDLADQFRCRQQNIAPANCPSPQVTNFRGGNPNLLAENAKSFNLGAVVDIGDNFSASLDYYNVKLSGGTSQQTLASINANEADYDELDPGIVVNRGEPSTRIAVAGDLARNPDTGELVAAGDTVVIPGAIIDIIRPLSNALNTDTSGIDFGFHYGYVGDNGVGLSLDMAWVYVFKYRSPGSGRQVGTENGSSAFPSDRVTTSISLSNAKLALSLNSTYISGFENVSETDRYDSWLGHDLTLVWSTAFGIEGLSLTTGAINLTNKGPSIDPTAGYNSGVVRDLYQLSGRIPFLNFKYRVGGN